MIIVIIPFFVGCSSVPKQEDGIDEEKLKNLLFTDGYFARKSITIKDIIVKDEC